VADQENKYDFLDWITRKIAWACVIILLVGLLFVGFYGWWTEYPSTFTQIELDAMVMCDADATEYFDRDADEPWIYRYENDKIIIASSHHGGQYLPNEYPYTDPFQRTCRFLPDDGPVTIAIWIKPDPNDTIMFGTRMVHGSITDKKATVWSTPRGQDQFRTQLTINKGHWIKYLHKIADDKRTETLKKAQPQIDAWAEENMKEYEKRLIKMEAEKEQKELEEQAQQESKEDRIKILRPINDKDLFKGEI